MLLIDPYDVMGNCLNYGAKVFIVGDEMLLRKEFPILEFDEDRNA